MSDKDNWLALRKYLDGVMKENRHQEETRMLRISDFVDEQIGSGPTPVAADGAAPCAKCGTRGVLWKCRVCGHDNRFAANA